jgi:hypothetical protein
MTISRYLVKYIRYEYDGISIKGANMEGNWQARVKNLLKAELKRRDVSYKDLVAKLAALGIKETEQNLRTKISRGGFTAVFFFQCMEAIGAKTIRLSEED